MTLHFTKTARPALLAALATALTASAAHAAEPSKPLVMSGFADAAAGEELMAGNYAAVIRALAPHGVQFDKDEVAASTNLCVAYAASGQLEQARKACEEAITMARTDEPGITLTERVAHQDALGLAFANRAVVTRLSGE